MKNAMTAILGILLCLALPACAPKDDARSADPIKRDRNLECAAMISAANALMTNGSLENDPELNAASLVGMMTYLNKYAIPKDLREPEAFEQLNARREALIAEHSPEKIRTRAKKCLGQ